MRRALAGLAATFLVATAGATTALLFTGDDSPAQTSGGQVVMQTFTHEDVVTYTIPPPETVTVTQPAPPTTSPTTTAPVSYVKILDSANAAVPCGGAPGTVTCPIHKDDLGGGMGRGDSFSLTCADYCRDTWIDLHTFNRGKTSDWEFMRRWTRHDRANSGHFAIGEIRQGGTAANSNCEGGGNAFVQSIRLEVDVGSPERYTIWVQGGPTMWQSESSHVSGDLGPVDPVGSIHMWRFKVLFDYAHGAITVWKDGAVVFTRPDIPIGFHFACDRTTVVPSDYKTQFGVYTHSTGTQILDETSWRFRCYEAASCP